MRARVEVPARNNFDLLRFAFAGIVVLYHARILSAAPELSFLGIFSADLAVKSFFVVSGFLVFMSFENSRSIGEYAGKRIRRIYPAYFTVVVGAAILGAFLTELSWNEYFSGGLMKYLAANLVFANFLAHDLPGVFVHNPLTEVNGALWTIKVEVMFYAVVPLLAWLAARLGRWPVLGIAYVAGTVWVIVFTTLAERTGSSVWVKLSYQLPGQIGYFAAGALCYYYVSSLQRHWTTVAGIGFIGMAIVSIIPAARVFVEPAALALVVVFLAFGMRYLGNFARFGDFSYGIYIIHVPVLQTLVAKGAFRANAFAALVLAIVLVLALAYLCWHFVEKPFLKRGSHYVVANTSGRAAAMAPMQ